MKKEVSLILSIFILITILFLVYSLMRAPQLNTVPSKKTAPLTFEITLENTNQLKKLYIKNTNDFAVTNVRVTLNAHIWDSDRDNVDSMFSTTNSIDVSETATVVFVYGSDYYMNNYYKYDIRISTSQGDFASDLG